MIHVINKYNRQLYGDLLEDMYRLRHDIFVDQKKWYKLRQKDGLEQDQWDNEDTTYLLKVSPEGKILGGMRMYPTTGETQLSTIFRDTCVLEQQPSAPNHYEWSRYFIADPTYRGARGKPVHMELYTGILEYAVASGIQSLSGYIEVNTFTRSTKMPWEMRQLGIPTEYGGTCGEPIGYGLPTQLTISETMLRKTKILWRMIKPVLSLSIGTENLHHESGYKAETVIRLQTALSQLNTPQEVQQLIDELTHNMPSEPSDCTPDSLANNYLHERCNSPALMHASKPPQGEPYVKH